MCVHSLWALNLQYYNFSLSRRVESISNSNPKPMIKGKRCWCNSLVPQAIRKAVGRRMPRWSAAVFLFYLQFKDPKFSCNDTAAITVSCQDAELFYWGNDEISSKERKVWQAGLHWSFLQMKHFEAEQEDGDGWKCLAQLHLETTQIFLWDAAAEVLKGLEGREVKKAETDLYSVLLEVILSLPGQIDVYEFPLVQLKMINMTVLKFQLAADSVTNCQASNIIWSFLEPSTPLGPCS